MPDATGIMYVQFVLSVYHLHTQCMYWKERNTHMFVHRRQYFLLVILYYTTSLYIQYSLCTATLVPLNTQYSAAYAEILFSNKSVLLVLLNAARHLCPFFNKARH